VPLGFDAIESNGRLPQGLSQYYRATGYEPALDLAKKVAGYFRYDSGNYDEQERFLWADIDRNMRSDEAYNAKYEVIGGHAHDGAVCLLSLLDYAITAADRDTIQFVGTSFEWAKSQQDSPFNVSALVG
jgi:hypothetical protein